MPQLDEDEDEQVVLVARTVRPQLVVEEEATVVVAHTKRLQHEKSVFMSHCNQQNICQKQIDKDVKFA